MFAAFFHLKLNPPHMETTRGNIFLKRNVRSKPKYISDENQR